MGTRGEKTRREGLHRTDADAKSQTTRRPPSPWNEELNPNRMSSGPDVRAEHAEGERAHRTAYDLKGVHHTLSEEFSDDELRGIPVIPEGQRLQQGGIYIDLKDPRRKEFTATGDMSAGSRNLYTSKSEVPYTLWNRLVGPTPPDRIQGRKNVR